MQLYPKLFLIIFLVFSVVYFQQFYTHNAEQPNVSIITSMYDADKFIEDFLHDIVNQTIFNQCELIIINANSPGNEEPIIKKYQEQYSNIRYSKLNHDPGIYGVWNMAIKIARAPFITNANCDDRRNPESIAQQMRSLEQYPDVDLVYQDFIVTQLPNQTYKKNDPLWITNYPEFNRKHMHICLPGPMPMWRKEMHKKYGYFDENYKSAGDWEMWLRAIDGGAQFKKASGICGLYYLNPAGLSTHQETKKMNRHANEVKLINQKYCHIWR